MSVFRTLLAATAALLLAAPLGAQRQPAAADLPAFFDQIHAPNWLGTDILHTPIKAQRGGTCWSFATISFLESEALRTGRASAENGGVPDVSEYYVVYWNWVNKARDYAVRQGQGFHGRADAVPFGDGGLPHDVLRVVREHGLVPEAAYVEPENSGAMTREILAAMEDQRAAGTWSADAMERAVREVLDRHLAPPPTSIEHEGRTLTPQAYARDVLGVDPDAYVEVMSYTDVPFYTRGEVDVPDNWWDYDRYLNVPLEAFVRVINRALDAGYSVALDTDWGDVGASWNQAGIAVIHPNAAPAYAINQDTRQADFVEHRTTDDHLVHAVDHRVLDGQDWYLIKNSHGTSAGRRGYVWMRGDWLALRVLNLMVHRDALDPALLARFGG